MQEKKDKELDKHFMMEALKQAELALSIGEVPVGAVLVNADGIILSRGYNCIEDQKSQMAHAEVIAIKKASEIIGDWRMDGCCLYVTLEPCLMCTGLIRLSRIPNVVFGAKSTLFGLHKDFDSLPLFYREGLTIRGGVLEKECLEIIKSFFRIARKKGKD